jgi:hypothetical protein
MTHDKSGGLVILCDDGAHRYEEGRRTAFVPFDAPVRLFAASESGEVLVAFDQTDRSSRTAGALVLGDELKTLWEGSFSGTPRAVDCRGGSAALAMVAAGCAANMSVGIAAAVIMLGVIFVTRYMSLGIFAGALVCIAVSVVMLDEALMLRLVLFSAGLVLIKHIPALVRILRKTEPRLSFAEDITYKLDE